MTHIFRCERCGTPVIDKLSFTNKKMLFKKFEKHCTKCKMSVHKYQSPKYVSNFQSGGYS